MKKKRMITVVLAFILLAMPAFAITPPPDWEKYPPAVCGDNICEPKPTECPEDCEDIEQIIEDAGLPEDWQWDKPIPLWFKITLPIILVVSLLIGAVLVLRKKKGASSKRLAKRKSPRKKRQRKRRKSQKK